MVVRVEDEVKRYVVTVTRQSRMRRCVWTKVRYFELPGH
jgi:hypothetical protein